MEEKLKNNKHYPTFTRHLFYQVIKAGLSDSQLILLLVLRYSAYDKDGPKKCQIKTTQQAVAKLLNWSTGKTSDVFNKLLSLGVLEKIKSGYYFINEQVILNLHLVENSRHKQEEKKERKENFSSPKKNLQIIENNPQSTEKSSLTPRIYKDELGHIKERKKPFSFPEHKGMTDEQKEKEIIGLKNKLKKLDYIWQVDEESKEISCLKEEHNYLAHKILDLELDLGEIDI